jgi:type II secretory pathway pseudopilin PulG
MRRPFSKMLSVGGFTFVEGLVVLAIFVSMIVSISGVFLMAYRAQAGSYNLELDEQSNMRAAFELENLFRSSVGYELVARGSLAALNSGSIAPPQESSSMTMFVPALSDGDLEMWGFDFVSSGQQDAQGRDKGSIRVVLPNGGTYVYTTSAVIPSSRTYLFQLDEYGRLNYHWISPTVDSELEWKGSLPLYQ